MAERDKILLGKQILNPEDLRITVEYNGEMFTMRYPTPLEKSTIEVEISRRIGGLSRDSFPIDHLRMVEAATYVENLIDHKQSPAWFQSAWTCYDEGLIGKLYAEYLAFRDRFQLRVSTGGFSLDSKGSGA